MACFLRHVPETTIRIPSNRSQHGVTYYTIAITVGPHSWTVSHRYREFRELHERLVAEHGIAKELLPPKKVLGNRAAAFLDQRQRQLELYLQQVLAGLQTAMCREFVEFLHFNRYDLVYLLQDMAQRFFLQGVPILEQVQHYDFSVLELYAIAERLRMPCPAAALMGGGTAVAATNTLWKCYDFSHVLEFCTQLDGMRVVRRKPKEQWTGSSGAEADESAAAAAGKEKATTATSEEAAIDSASASSASTAASSPSSSAAGAIASPPQPPPPPAAAAELIGTSNIDAAALRLDLGAFHALTALTLDGVAPHLLSVLGTLRDTLRTLTVRRTRMRRLAEVLLCDSIHQVEDAHDGGKRWPWLTHLDAADNCIDELDASVTLLPRLEVLRLDNNRLERIETGTLNQLPALSEVSLAGNRLVACTNWHLELGNIRALGLARNGLCELRGLRRMFSLVRLDVEANRLDGVDEVEQVAELPCLEELRLAGNPMASVVDYRPKVLSRFGERAAELTLDGQRGTTAELDMALVLAALRQSDQLRQPTAQSTTNISR